MTPAPDVDVAALSRVLEDSAPEVLVGYLFGSHVTGAPRAGSDVDVAVLLQEPLATARRLGLLADLTDAVPGRRVDLVLLNDAPPALGYRVLRDGVPLVVRDEGARVRHHAETLDRYFDTEPLRRELDRGQRRRIREGSFGRA